MSLLPQLLGLARHCRYVWVRPHATQASLRISAAAAGTSSGSGGGNLAAPVRAPPQQRRGVAAGAGRRGNVFLDDSPKRRTPADAEYNEPTNGQPLFDSSRFNYDSDEEEQQQQAAQEQEHEEHHQAAADDGQDQEAASSTTAAAAAAQQLRRRARGGLGAAAAVAAASGGLQEGQDLVLPPARAVKIKTAEFVKSSVTVDQCPAARYPEFAVIGRSNVGKSSLINMITGRNALAMVSKTPGKTRCINHFVINGSWFLVDLPGYGYAKTSKVNAVEWNRFTREYFVERETLVTVLLLVDASIPPMPLDVACAAWFAEAEIPFTIVFTKLDKKKKGGSPSDDNIAAFEEQVGEACGYVPPTIRTSSKSGQGRTELLAHVAQLRDFFNKGRHGM